MQLSIECEREEDGRWIAEIIQIPGAMAYGATRDEAIARAEIVALRTLVDPGKAGPGRSPKDRMVDQATDRFPSSPRKHGEP